MVLLRRGFLSWLPIAVSICCLGLLGYVAVQQVYRNGANDPQIQIAEDAARALAQGASPEAVVGTRTVDLRAGNAPGSLAPFAIVFDRSATALASSGRLDGETPIPPAGVLDAAVSRGRNTVTWQPSRDVRIAAVAVPDRRGDKARYVVLVGRSLREVEHRIGELSDMALVSWVFTLGVTFVAALAAEKFRERA